MTGDVVRSPRDAFEAGLNKYFTGKPCKRGHVSERYLTNGHCVECAAEAFKTRGENYARVKAWRKANPDKVAEQSRRYTKKHPETARKAKEKHRAANIDTIRERDRIAKATWRRQYPEAQKARYERHVERAERQRETIAGRPRATQCEICTGAGRTVFDHCHSKGSFRGWICDRCNKVLGLVYDKPALLRALADYLEGDGGEAQSKAA